MSITLYGSQISTFARKVAVALDLKELAFEHVDALTAPMKEQLRAANPRVEVPVLVDGDITVVNSSDIIQYLDLAYPERPLLPASLRERVLARAFERLADQRLDPVVVDCSYWSWAERDDSPPEGLIAAAQADVEALFDRARSDAAGAPKTMAVRHARRRRVRVVSQSRGDADLWAQSRCGPLSGRCRLVEGDPDASGVCRRRPTRPAPS